MTRIPYARREELGPDGQQLPDAGRMWPDRDAAG